MLIKIKSLWENDRDAETYVDGALVQDISYWPDDRYIKFYEGETECRARMSPEEFERFIEDVNRSKFTCPFAKPCRKQDAGPDDDEEEIDEEEDNE